MRTITLSDGTIYENASYGPMEGGIVCFLNDADLCEAFYDFNDADKTAIITAKYGDQTDRLEGYTKLIAIQQDRYSWEIMIRLIKPEQP